MSSQIKNNWDGIEGKNKTIITEFTAHDLFSLVTGWAAFTLTIQAPHPPSEHINLVPLSSALVRMNVFKLVSTGTVDEFTIN